MPPQYEKRFLAIWRPVQLSAYWYASGFSQGEFKSLNQTHFSEGDRLVCIDYYEPADSYGAVWHHLADGSGEHWGPWQDFEEFTDQDDFEKKHKGRRLVTLEVADGEVLGVWRTGSFSYYFALGRSFDDFNAQNDEQMKNKGRRLVTVIMDDGEYSGLWHGGSGLERYLLNVDSGVFWAQHALFKEQEHLHCVSLDSAGGGYSAVWRPGTGPNPVHTGLTAAELKAKDTEYKSQGLCLTWLKAKHWKVA